MKRIWKPLVAILVFGLLLWGMNQLPLKQALEPVFSFVEDAGVWGYFLFVGLGIVLTVLFVPVMFLVTSSGLIFGLGMGFFLSSCILVGGTGIGYGAGNVLWPRLRNWSMFQGDVFQAVRRAVESDGPKLIAFLRMTPFFHFMTGNLFFGSLDVKFAPYLLFSYLGMIPGTLLVTYAGTVAGRTIQGEGEVSVWQGVFFGFGVVVFSLISWRVARTTRRILHEKRGKE